MITSTDNSTIKQIKKLKDKKYRDEQGLYIVEGQKLVADAIRLNAPICHIVTTEQKQLDVYEAIVVSNQVFETLSDTVSSQGILATVKLPCTDVKAPIGNSVILEDVQDPSNVGAIMRTAAACGYTDVYLTKNCADAFSPKSIRSAMSAHFVCKIHVGDIEEIISAVKKDSKLFVADMHGENVFALSQKPNKHCLLVGNEGNGVSRFALKNADFVISLPMKNNFESLNAAVSCGILMFMLSNS